MLHFVLLMTLAVCALPVVWSQMQSYQRARVSAVLMQSDTLRNKVQGLIAGTDAPPSVQRDLANGHLPDALHLSRRRRG